MKWDEEQIRRATIIEVREYWRSETSANLSKEDLQRLQELHEEYHLRFDEFDSFDELRGFDKIAAEMISPEVGGLVKRIHDRNGAVLGGVTNVLKRLREMKDET